jgi:hypothetical protein
MVAAWNLTGNTNVNEHTKFLGTKDSHALVIKTNNQEAARVDPSGNVGIGTTAPNAPLQIGSDTYIRDSKIILDAGNGAQYRAWSMRVPYGDTTVTSPNYGFVIRDETGGTDRFVIDWQTGNVGIGKANPQAALDVNGNIVTNGDISLTNADCAEDFTISGEDEPGTVMVLGDQDTLKPSEYAYDKRVAGVISGAGDYKPGIVLDKQPNQRKRSAISLLGKVFCKVDARYGSITVGDLLTTSNTPGHAMKATDPFKAFGSVIGKALRPLREGQGLIPILIALQ